MSETIESLSTMEIFTQYTAARRGKIQISEEHFNALKAEIDRRGIDSLTPEQIALASHRAAGHPDPPMQDWTREEIEQGYRVNEEALKNCQGKIRIGGMPIGGEERRG